MPADREQLLFPDTDIPTLENTRKFGVGYQGSKSRFAKDIINALPPAKYFYDLFAGGCAITHAAILSGKYEYVHANDLHGFGVKIFRDAIKGKYKDRTEWVSREDFNRLYIDDPFVSICWSFGNSFDSYLFSPENEKIKRAAHYACFGNNSELKALFPDVEPFIVKGESVGKRYESFKAWRRSQIDQLQRLQQLERLERLQQLEQLQRLEQLKQLQRLEQLKRLTITQCDYRDITIDKDSVVYCDIPYKNTKKYMVRFDHDDFYDWVKKQPNKIFVSEYEAPSFLKEVWSKETSSTICSNKVKRSTEKLFANEHAIEAILLS